MLLWVSGWAWGRLIRQSSLDLLTLRDDEVEGMPGGSLYKAVFSPDSRYILDDRPGFLIKSLFDIRTGKTVAATEPYDGWRGCTQFMANSRDILVGSGDHTVEVVNPWTGTTLMRFDSGNGSLQSFVISPNGKLAAGYNVEEATGTREVVLWEVATARALKRFSMEPTSLNAPSDAGAWERKHWMPKGRALGFLSDNRRLVCVDEHLMVVDIETG